MANREQVDRLKRSVEEWNEWREENPEVLADLSGSKFRGFNFSHAQLFRTSLEGADLTGANLSDANLRAINFKGANLTDTCFWYSDLTGANLMGANLTDASFYRADFRWSVFYNANLTRSNLESAILISANLGGANLSGANLYTAQALGTSFRGAILTGACIADWNINSETNLQDVICGYIFTGYDWDNKKFTNRLPHHPNQIFAPGEFTKRYQVVLETVDLFFNEGIDWKALLASLHDLQSEYVSEVGIQGIEKKAGGSFVVRLEIPPDIDKGAIERAARERYEAQLRIVEAQYRAELQGLNIQLQSKDEIIALHLKHNAQMEEITKLLASKPITVEAKAVAENQSSSHTFNNNMQGATIGNFANTMQDQASMQANQYIGARLDEIAPLIHSLRGMAETFPQEQRQEAIEYLDEIETDLKQSPEKRKLSRAKAALLALMATATAVSGAVTGANEFVTQTQELAEKLGIPLPIEQAQPQSSKTVDVKASEGSK